MAPFTVHAGRIVRRTVACGAVAIALAAVPPALAEDATAVFGENVAAGIADARLRQRATELCHHGITPQHRAQLKSDHARATQAYVDAIDQALTHWIANAHAPEAVAYVPQAQAHRQWLRQSQAHINNLVAQNTDPVIALLQMNRLWAGYVASSDALPDQMNYFKGFEYRIPAAIPSPLLHRLTGIR